MPEQMHPDAEQGSAAKRFRGQQQQPPPLKREDVGVMPDSFSLPAAHLASPAGQRSSGGPAPSAPRPLVQGTQGRGKRGGSTGQPADPIAGVEQVIRQIIAASQDAVASSLRAQEVASRALEVARRALEQHDLAERQTAATDGTTPPTQGPKRKLLTRPHGTKVLGDLSQAKRKQAHIERWLQAKEMAKKELGFTVSYTQDTPEGKALCARTKRIYNQILAAERQQVTKTKTEPGVAGPSAVVQRDSVATEAVAAVATSALKLELDL